MASNLIQLVPNDLADKSIQLSYRLFSAENFFIKAMQYHVASKEPGFDPKTTIVLENLNTPTCEAIKTLAAALPKLLNPETFSPPTHWAEIVNCFHPPMHSTLEQIIKLEAQIIALSELKQPPGERGAKLIQKLHKKIIERETKFRELRTNLIVKNEKRTQLLDSLQHNIQANPQAGNSLNKILTDIERCTKGADRFRRWQQPLAILTGSLSAMGRGPYLPFGVIGQLCSPISGLATQYCRLQSLRSNPSTSPSKHRQRILRSTWLTAAVGSIGILAAASAGILKAAAIPIATPFLLPIAATSILISNISNTVTAVTHYKNAIKRPLETKAGKKIRMKGHVADVLLNFSNVIASSGLLGITLTTVGVLFPPATLATLGTVSLGIVIGATVVSAGAYLRKTACWEKANNLKLFTDFQYACQYGLIDALNPSIKPKQMRNIAKPNLSSRFFSLFNRDHPLNPPKPEIKLRCTSANADPKETVRHFEQVLDMGFIPSLINTEDKPTFLPRLTPTAEPPKIRLTHLTPPDPLLAICAIFEQGGMPAIHDKKMQQQIFKAYNNMHPQNSVSTFEQAYTKLCNRYVPKAIRLTFTNERIHEATSAALSLEDKPVNYLYKTSPSRVEALKNPDAAQTRPKPMPTRPTPNDSE